MYLTSLTKIKKSHPLYKEVDSFCLLSKKLKNKIIWLQREAYKNNQGYISFYTMIHELAKNNDPDYRALPARAAQYTAKTVDEMFKSFFALRKKGLKARPPRFSEKGDKGRFIVIFDYHSISRKAFKKGFIKPSGMTGMIPIPKYLKDIKLCYIKEVRFVPKGNFYQMEIVYITKEEEYQDTGNYAAVDVGLKNFLTICTNNSSPALVKGKKFIDTSAYWIRHKADMQSRLKKNVRTSKRIQVLTEKRNNKVRNDIHCLTKRLINYFKGLQISDVYIGWNTGIKHGINLGKRTNQKFVYLPHKKLIDTLGYKCQRAGMKLHTVPEAYTSKCSFIDNEEIKKHKEYMGKRVTTKFFVSKNGTKINADVNAAYNILRQSRGIQFSELDPRQMYGTPKVLDISYGYTRRNST